MSGSNTIVSHLGTLVDKLSQNDEIEDVSIAFGFRPSGQLHLGNMTTLLAGAFLAEYMGNHRTDLKVTNCDIELLGPKDIKKVVEHLRPEIRKKIDDTAVYFKDVPAPDDLMQSMSEKYGGNFVELLNHINESKNVRSKVHLLSDIQKEEGYRQMLKNYCEASEEVAKLFPERISTEILKTNGGNYIFPICPETQTGSKFGSKYENGKIKGRSEITGDKFEFDIMDPSYNIATHFFLDPLRDVMTSAKAQIHIFGGDYAQPNQEEDLSPIEKIDKIFDLATPEGAQRPILYSGPILYAENGAKLGKSKSNGLQYDKIKNLYGEEVVDKLWSFVGGMLESGIKHVDFSYTRQNLLSKH